MSSKGKACEVDLRLFIDNLLPDLHYTIETHNKKME